MQSKHRQFEDISLIRLRLIKSLSIKSLPTHLSEYNVFFVLGHTEKRKETDDHQPLIYAYVNKRKQQ